MVPKSSDRTSDSGEVLCRVHTDKPDTSELSQYLFSFPTRLEISANCQEFLLYLSLIVNLISKYNIYNIFSHIHIYRIQNQLVPGGLKVLRFSRMIFFSLIFCYVIVSLIVAVSAATTEVHIAKYAADNTTVMNERTVTYQWMEANLSVMGDGVTHYYHQGPVFIDDSNPAREEQLRLNTEEDTNVKEKDMGAVKGTSLKDLCDIAGGMAPGDVVKIKADDGFTKTFAYENIYTPNPRQGPLVIAWYHNAEGYVPDYRTGMRLIFFADNSTNPWRIHVFGNYDWHESAAPEYWYYYRQGDEKYPTTTGLSVQSISDILIYSPSIAEGIPVSTLTTAKVSSPTQAGTSPFPIVCLLAGCAFLGSILHIRR